MEESLKVHQLIAEFFPFPNDLEAEILISALLYLKDNPDKSVKEAIIYGFNEWIK